MCEADLEAVAAELGLQRDRHDKHKWKDTQHTISISGSQFMDWKADKGGGGAIDLVMHVRNSSFREALSWLSGQNFEPRPSYPIQSQDTEHTARSLEMPIPNEQRWNAVRNYLIATRGLPEPLSDRLHEWGLIYADDLQNAVFVRYGNTPIGSETAHACLWERLK